MTSISVVSVPVSDQARAKRFYRDALGFEEIRNAPFDQGRWVELRPPGGGPSVSLVTWFDPMPAGALQGTVLTTDDIEKTAAAMQERGVELRQPIAQAPWGRFTTFADPDGNGWVLQQPLERA